MKTKSGYEIARERGWEFKISVRKAVIMTGFYGQLSWKRGIMEFKITERLEKSRIMAWYRAIQLLQSAKRYCPETPDRSSV